MNIKQSLKGEWFNKFDDRKFIFWERGILIK